MMAVPARLRRRWGMLLSGYWFIPTAILLLVGALALALIELDTRLWADDRRLGYTGGPNSAREFLSAIASSTLTFTALVFSVTVIVLQLASGQFSPRVLRTFLRDHGNQATLGVFLGTFMYALLVLWEVRGEDGAGATFVPGVAVAFSLVLVVLSLGFFIRYIHNITNSIRVIEIIDRVSRETAVAIERTHPDDADIADGEVLASGDVGPVVRVVRSDARGVVTSVDVRRLAQVARRSGTTLVVVPRPGEFLATGMPLVIVHGNSASLGDDDEGAICAAITLGKERDLGEDPAFGLRQLVDIAERALSPGINDPTTASQCLDHLHDLLRSLAVRPLPSAMVETHEGRAVVVVPQPTWDDYVALALDEIRHWGADSIQIHQRIGTLLDDLVTTVSIDRLSVLEERRQMLDARLADLPRVEHVTAAGG